MACGVANASTIGQAAADTQISVVNADISLIRVCGLSAGHATTIWWPTLALCA
ncbi:hypothetical protein ABIB80_000271 [Bradyrhizobium sp. i1.15.2]|uniref:hypothetical protein n=1 Tax=Bradyrhizobium sp. i1.15.2 TaxID=3156362 RepID=UPI0033962A89